MFFESGFRKKTFRCVMHWVTVAGSFCYTVRLRESELPLNSRCCCLHRSTGVFVFLYALFYYFKRSNMSGALQSIEFFGYSFLACYVFFLMLGTVSFAASLKFIRYIYVNIKMD